MYIYPRFMKYVTTNKSILYMYYYTIKVWL